MSDNFVIRNGVLDSYTGNDLRISIPAGVTRIGKKAFTESKIREISFDDEMLKSIDDMAFYGCKNLKSIHIPNGVVQIGDRAFYGCSKLEYIVIPDSVIVVGDDVLGGCSDNLLIIGNKNGEAGNIAKQYNLVIKSELKQTISAHIKAKKTRASVESRTFDVFGETVTCSNSLVRYQENLEFYINRKQSVFDAFFSKFPKNLSLPMGNVGAALEAEKNLVINRLASQGVFVSPDVIDTYVVDPYRAIVNVALEVRKAHEKIAQDVSDGIASDESALIREAESKVTGLSYGVIGDGLDMIAHSIDDYLARKRQREEAYAVAKQKLAASQKSHTSHGYQVYTNYLAAVAPSLRRGTDMLVDALCHAENDQLMKAGIIDPTIQKNIDIAKSVQLMESIVNDLGDNLFTVALAIKKYPCNMAALIYAYDHGHMCEGLSDLVSFLQLQDKLEAGLKECRKTRLKKLQNLMKDVPSGNEGVLIIQENARLLDDADVKELLHTLAFKKIGPLIEKLSPLETDTMIDSDEYWDKLLASVISEENWKYYQLHGIRPVISSKIPGAVKEDYVQLRNWIAEKVKKAKDAIYDAAKKLMSSNLISDYQDAIKRFETIRDWRDSSEQIVLCQQKIAELEAKKERERLAAKRNKKIAMIVTSIVCAIIIVFIIVLNTVIIPNGKYNDAIALMEAGKLDEAYSIFKGIDYKDSVEKAGTIRLIRAKETLSNPKIGECIKLGAYEQDNDLTNGKEDIEWLVLDIKDNRLLVISKYALEYKTYNSEWCTWEESFLRMWLNNQFIETAFSNVEVDVIPLVLVEADKNANWDDDPGNPTYDQLFLLGYTEVIRYFQSESERICKLTDYVLSYENYYWFVDGYGSWYLRSPGDYRNVAFVTEDGDIHYTEAYYEGPCIRPAMWIDLSAIQ